MIAAMPTTQLTVDAGDAAISTEWQPQSIGGASLGLYAHRLPIPARASIVAGSLQLGSIWLTSVGLSSGAAAAWALLTGGDVQASAADGAALGFIGGLPITACAALMLLFGL